MTTGLRFTLIEGQKDTRRDNGRDYGTISYAEIVHMAEAPLALEKSKAHAFIPSAYSGPDARSHAVQREVGQFHALVLDVDDGIVTLDELDQAIVSVLGGCQRIIYSTSSATAEGPKWRVIVPVQKPMSGSDYGWLQQALFEGLDAHGICCDYALARAGQLSNLPNVPAEHRDANGTPFFYDFRVSQADVLAVPPSGLTERASQLAQQAKAAEELARSVSAEKAAERLRKREFDGLLTPIEQFKQDHDLVGLMLECGWLHRGGNSYASPFSQSKGPSVQVFDDRAVSYTSSDIGQLGKTTANGWTTYDAWDVYVRCIHGGNERAALEEYCEASGYNQVRLHLTIKKWGL